MVDDDVEPPAEVVVVAPEVVVVAAVVVVDVGPLEMTKSTLELGATWVPAGGLVEITSPDGTVSEA